jgi:pimeloyl-ACP methyl ester carboxylesterase
VTSSYSAAAPLWFERSIAQPFEDAHVSVDGKAIHYMTWGQPGQRGLVFVHGGGANAYWWAPIAATFSNEFRVVAIDLSGHGDSQHRDVYALEQWTDEVMAVSADAEIRDCPVIVGHSMGGFVTVVTAARHAGRVDGVVICDSPITKLDPEVTASRLREEFGYLKTYVDFEDAVRRFRTVPPQDHYLNYVMDFVARHSLRPVDGGWQWKFDRQVFEQFRGTLRGVAEPYLAEVPCRVALLRSEYGLVTPDIGVSMYEGLGRVAPVIEIPEAGHHAMLDQPLLLITALRTLLADWQHSEPHRR